MSFGRAANVAASSLNFSSICARPGSPGENVIIVGFSQTFVPVPWVFLSAIDHIQSVFEKLCTRFSSYRGHIDLLSIFPPKEVGD